MVPAGFLSFWFTALGFLIHCFLQNTSFVFSYKMDDPLPFPLTFIAKPITG
jgi:hypothetical protein